MIINRIRLALQPIELIGACDLLLDHRAGENGYVVKAALGLGPPSGDVLVEGFTSAGQPLIDILPENRELVFRIGFNPGIGQSYSGLRDELYKLISRPLYVKLMNNALTMAQISGFIRQFEVLHFTKEPEVQITIECQDSVFTAPEFIYAPTTGMGEGPIVIDYQEGTAPTGFVMIMNFSGTDGGFGFALDTTPNVWGQYNHFQVTYPILPGDVVTLYTQRGERKVNLYRSSVNTNITGYINEGAAWPRLHPGANHFDLEIANGASILLRYYPRFWGV